MQTSDLRVWILYKLAKHGYIGGRHTAFDNIPKGAPQHLHKEILETARQLVKEGFLLLKPTGYGLHVYLNPRKMDEITEIIKEIEKNG